MTARMIELNLDDQDVADGTGLSKDTIRAYRRLPEARPTAENAAAVAKALRWTTDQLLHGTDVEVSADDKADYGDEASLDDAIDRVKAIVAAGCNTTPRRVSVTITII
ncbi:helix-turn-helix domain-containing protein [Bradyrhizobium sp. CCBAU 45384]|uniref:helix-turn-helix domain-containing protein n=1 Tax=Bradyrhizobium sp. CCBAU 45384 TaxID=858428 RepID=UPI002305169D|nr:helix-turn-helix domain-containing protein [Bradyrhizobium sp. CCBAU 45384]